ncbi:alpha-hydroxy-acid oxidizing protein [Gluconacetobacter tumulisoli]|uniref:Alpha-hydroxy-acid oxidizing protein n=2 Tax=Gluconacetobacter tumulisoli TaxID=1286189 RepID=A0A7W4PJM7_9PROT|nr:alpha-hydroxy-acid oxidizing protein [Gluconacetobacter tumulisoli]
MYEIAPRGGVLARIARPVRDRLIAAWQARRNQLRYLNLDDYTRDARRFLPRALFAYVAGSAGDGRALAANRTAFDRWCLVPHVLRGVGGRSARTTILGQDFAMPVGISAFGAAAVVGFDADLAMARAARAAGVPYQLSANSITPMEEVIRANPDAWFAAYLPSSLSVIERMMARTARAGFTTLVITVDVPVGARREDETRARYTMPLRPSLRLAFDMLTHPRWVAGRFARTLLARGIPHIENIAPVRGPSIFARSIGPVGGAADFNWEHIRAIRRMWRGRLVLKGILAPDDAIRARDIGVDGIIVSNHGARLFDSVIAPLEALPAIRQACPDMTILLDSGVRRAGDVIKAIALGADGVMIGRPFFFATILGGQAGLAHAIRLVAGELDREMAFLGLLDLRESRRNRLHPRP